LAQETVSPYLPVLISAGIPVAGFAVSLLAWILARKFFPIPAVEPLEPPFTNEEGRFYARWQMVWLAPRFLFVWLLLGGVWYFLLVGLASLFHRVGPGTLYLLPPCSAFWGLPAMSLGILSSAMLMDWLCRFYFGDRAHRYERFSMGLSGIDERRAFPWFAGLVIAGCVVCVLVGLTTFTRFDADGIEIRRPFSRHSRFYGYARVNAIEHRASHRAPSGEIVKGFNHVVLFDDGTIWSTYDGLRVPIPELDQMIVQLISEKARRGVVEKP
jgi:hypothetical protein